MAANLNPSAPLKTVDSIKRQQRKKGSYFAVTKGRTTGIFESWQHCKASTNGFSNATYKGFPTLVEAVEFLNINGLEHDDIFVNLDSSQPKPLTAYCEAHKVPIPKAVPAVCTTRISDHDGDDIPIVTVDGACSNNGSDTAKGGIGIYWGPGHKDNVSEPTPSDGVIQTNNRAELYAAIRALDQAVSRGIGEIIVRTDSAYVVSGASTHLQEWIRKKELTSRPNPILWNRLHLLCQKVTVKWLHVFGHQGDEANTIADDLAKQGADRYLGDTCSVTSAQPDDLALQVAQTVDLRADATPIPQESDMSDRPQESDRPKPTLQSAEALAHQDSELLKSAGALAAEDNPVAFTADSAMSTPPKVKPTIQQVSKLPMPTPSRLPTFCKQKNLSKANPPKEDDNQCLVDILSQTNEHLRSLGNLQTVVRDIEHKLVDKLIQSNSESNELRLSLKEKELDVCKKENTDLKAKLKTKSDLVLALEKKIREMTPLADTDSGATCLSCEKLNSMLNSEKVKNDSLRDNVLELSTDLFNVRSSQTNLESDLKAAKKRRHGLESTLDHVQKQLVASSAFTDQLKTDLVNAHRRVDDLSEEKVALKNHIGSISDRNCAIDSNSAVTSSISTNQNWSPVKSKKSAGRSYVSVPSPTCSAPQYEKSQDISRCEDEVSDYHSVTDGLDHGNQRIPDREPVDVLFVGNSNFRDLVPKRLYKNKVVKVQTLQEKNIRGAISFVSKCNMSPKVVVLQVADNTLANNDPETCEDQMEELLHICTQTFIGAKICVSEPLPRRMRTANQQQDYDNKCATFVDFLDKIESVQRIPHPSLTVVSSELFYDSVHLTQEGLARLVIDFKTVVNPLLGMKPMSAYDKSPRHIGFNHQRHPKSPSHNSQSQSYNQGNHRSNQYRPPPPRNHENQYYRDTSYNNPEDIRLKGLIQSVLADSSLQTSQWQKNRWRPSH